MSKNIIESLINKKQIIKDYGEKISDQNLAFHDLKMGSSGHFELTFGSSLLPDLMPKSWKKCDAITLTFTLNGNKIDLNFDLFSEKNINLKIIIENNFLLVHRMISNECVMRISNATCIHLIIRPFTL